MGKYNSRLYSRLGQSGSIFGVELMEQIKGHSIKVLSADMSVVAGLDRFKREYPSNFFNVGIAEQNLIGIASGLSSEGYKAIAVAQACFISMRSFEQIRQYLGYMKNPVVCIGINSGFSLSFFGNTHYAIEDISLMRCIPGMTILSPSDAGCATKAFSAALELDTPVYIRLSGALNCPVVYTEEPDFEIGKAIRARNGDDIAIFATGQMVYQSLKASEILSSNGISAEVWDMHTIKPIDKKAIISSLNKRLIVTIEEHNVIGGLGSAVSDVLSESANSPVLLKLGIQDVFMQVGDYSYLLNQARLTPDLIAENIYAALSR